MADTKITDLTELATQPATGDMLVIVDVDDTTMAATGTDKKITVTNLLAGVASGAPTDAQYVTLAANGTLSAERVLTAGTGITLTDAGAGSTVTVALGTEIDSQGAATGIGNPGPSLWNEKFAWATLAIPTDAADGDVYGFEATGIVTTNNTNGGGIGLWVGTSLSSGTQAALANSAVERRTWVINGRIIVRGSADAVVTYQLLQLFTDGASYAGVATHQGGSTTMTENLAAGRNLYVYSFTGSNTANDFVTTRHYAKLWRIV